MPWIPAALLPFSSTGAAGRSGGGRRVCPCVVAVFLLLFFSLPNKAAARSGSILCLPQLYLPLVHGIESEVESWRNLGRGSYAGTVVGRKE